MKVEQGGGQADPAAGQLGGGQAHPAAGQPGEVTSPGESSPDCGQVGGVYSTEKRLTDHLRTVITVVVQCRF